MKAIKRLATVLFLPMLIAVALFSAGDAGAVTCSPPTVVTGCTVDVSDSLSLTAVVPVSATAAPDVTTDSSASITATTAVVNGTITDVHGGDASIRGFNYGTTIAYDMTALSSGTFGTGPFSAALSGLACETLYHYQAYATNPAGTGLGADMTFTTDTCPVVVPPVESPGGGVILQTSSTVNFSGVSYPGARVVIMQDGAVIVAATADQGGNFNATIAGITQGSYVFSAYAQDATGRLSSAYSFPFYINGKSIVNIGGILIAPTISIDRSVISAGQAVSVSGQAAPGSIISLSVSAKTEKKYTALADARGFYSYLLDTTGFNEPVYSIRTQMLYQGHTSPFSKTLLLSVNGGVIPTQPTGPGTGGFCGAGRGDLNCDGRVDIVDYSIMKYWYRRAKPPVIVDLSGDGSITLKDFSILASEWTG